MRGPMRPAASAAAIVAVIILGVACTPSNAGTELPSATTGVSPSEIPSAAAYVAPSATSLPGLSATLTSAVHRYSISYPAEWTVRPAIEPWPAGFAVQDDRAFEAETDHFAIHTADTLQVTSQDIPLGSTFEDWLAGYRAFKNAELPDCTIPVPATWTGISIGGLPALEWWTPGCYYGGGAVVAEGGRVYLFTAITRFNTYSHVQDLERYLAPDLFLAMLATVQFDPASAVSAP